MVDHQDTWLIVPVYNEGPVVGDVIREVRKVFPNVVCVDDGSADNSAEEVRRAGAHLVRHPVNLGQGAALQTGIEYARSRPGAQYFVTYDADGQHQVADVERMVERLRTEPLDIVVGTRFHGDTSHIPWLKRLVLKTVVALSPRLRKLELTDAHNGLRAFNLRVAREMAITLNGMGHASQIVELIATHGWRVAEEPVTILYTEYSMAKGQSLINGVNIVFDSVLRTNARR
ncbi:Glycosyl transferase family 2 [Amycolatopsis arida]|uniref:Glycosyl transferase family 2 n=1 Tax=Amycolatopsis arida TaxID=587909 RepID=A0A1I5YK23_9PSEU|nr:glycosyltransferase family 2 protein [Amycolatopsis arida]TDX90574.1 glycosyl transferase family 2 [Amycolatopsis arida]SFQ44561.1 Glycosyl transferase family 2 [Amycolatopsis arida]